MRICSIDTTLNEKISPNTITNSINVKIANVKINIVKKIGPGLDRKTLERSHVLLISLPRKKLTQEQYIELISYIDIGGCLILTLPSPPWENLGRFFEEMRKELGIIFQPNFVYGLPKIPQDTRLVGSKLKITKAHVIRYNEDKSFLKENGIKKFVPLALMDNQPVVLAANKRRGKFIIFSAPEIFNERNIDFLSRLILLVSNKESLVFSKREEKRKLGNTNFYLVFQHACLDSYLLSLFHYNFMFHQDVISLAPVENLSRSVYEIIEKQKVLGKLPKLEDVNESLQEIISSR